MVNTVRDLLFALCFLAGFGAAAAGLYCLLGAAVACCRRKSRRRARRYMSWLLPCAATSGVASGGATLLGRHEWGRMAGFIDAVLWLTALVALCAGLGCLWRCLETLLEGPEESGRGAGHYSLLTVYCAVVLLGTGPAAFWLAIYLSLTTGGGPYCC